MKRLAFVHRPASFGALAVAEAARDLCELVWVVDTGDERLGSMVRLLNRLGTVIDVAGMTEREAVDAVRDSGVDGVLALADEALEWTAGLAAALDLPFHSVETAHLLTDKFAQRAALRAAGLDAPGSWVLREGLDGTEWGRIAESATFPAVLKPRRGEGSRNTISVTSLDEVREVVDETVDGARSEREWVLEEYIPDIEHEVCGERFANYVSVESFVVDGRATSLAVTGRTPPAKPFRETGFFIPAAVDAGQSAELVSAAEAAAAALGITIGCLHIEVKLTPRGPVVIEVNGRIGGGIPELLALTTDVDFLQLALRLAVGEKVRLERPNPRGLGYLLYVQAPDDVHRVTAITGLDELRAAPGVREIMLNRAPGQAVDWRDGNHGYVFSVLGVADDHDDFRLALDRVTELVRIDGD